METQTLESKIKCILIDQLGVTEAQLTDEARFTHDLGADSLDTVELQMQLEEDFNIRIEDEEIEKLNTVGQLIVFMKERVPNEQ